MSLKFEKQLCKIFNKYKRLINCMKIFNQHSIINKCKNFFIKSLKKLVEYISTVLKKLCTLNRLVYVK